MNKQHIICCLRNIASDIRQDRSEILRAAADMLEQPCFGWWIPVAERLPEVDEGATNKTSEKVWIFYTGALGGGRSCLGYYSKRYDTWFIGTNTVISSVTHWMPLPPAPGEV